MSLCYAFLCPLSRTSIWEPGARSSSLVFSGLEHCTYLPRISFHYFARPPPSPLERTLSAMVRLIELVVAASPQLSGFGSCTKKFSLQRSRKPLTDTVNIPSPLPLSWHACTNSFTQPSVPKASSGHTLSPAAPSLLRAYPHTAHL